MKLLSAEKPKAPPRRVDDTWRRTQAGVGQFFDLIVPWLFELGSWIFGALIALNVLILGVVLTIGPIDTAVKVATAAFAVSLPPNIAGFVLLRLVADMRKIRAPDKATQAFEEAGFQVEGLPDRQQAERRVSSVTLAYTYGLMALTLLLTLVGLTAVLWHSAWWIAVGFVVMLLASLGVVVAAASQLDGGQRWRTPTGQGEPGKQQRT